MNKLSSILVIDDSRVVRNQIKKMLQLDQLNKLAANIIEAKDGLEGWNLIIEQTPHLRLIILDWLLPKKSGKEIFWQIQQDTTLRKIPLLIISGRHQEIEIPSLYFDHYIEFLEKPFDETELESAIKSALTKSKNQPIQVSFSFNDNYQLHADGKPALRLDNQNYYAYSGTIIPNQYGQVPIKYWESEWFIKEENPKLIEVLAHGLQLEQKIQPVEWINLYHQTCRAVLLSKKSINHQDITDSIIYAYQLAQKKSPKVTFIESPLEIIEIAKETDLGWSLKLYETLYTQLTLQLTYNRDFEAELRKNRDISQPWLSHFINNHLNIIYDLSGHYVNNSTHHRNYQKLLEMIVVSVKFRYYIEQLKCLHNPLKWEIFQLLFDHGLWVFPSESTCWVSDRPLKLNLDSENRLHAEGEPALLFKDGYKIYSYHGVSIPERLGKLHPHQWSSDWILTETNAEIRRVLIQGIGYSRLCQELEAITLDTWREYTLLEIKANLEQRSEPIYLLKMTCPSTNFIHAHRVPPDMTSARQAIQWINHGIDPDEFVIQT